MYHQLDNVTPHSTRLLGPVLAPQRWSLLSFLALWFERHRQRRHLAELDDAMLRDIGLSRGAAVMESRKPFWQA